MSATRDKSQKVTFVYTNFYELFKKGKAEAQAAPDASQETGQAPGLKTASHAVLKTEDLHSPHLARIEPFKPIELIGKRVVKVEPAPVVTTRQSTPELTVETLKSNLNELQEMQKRMKFFLEELEDLLKND